MKEQDKELANQVTWYADVTLTELSRYAALIRADEREACAKLADAASVYNRFISIEISSAIRARGNT